MDRIKFSSKAWKRTDINTEDKPNVALDTETEKGKAFIIGYTSKLGSYQYTIKNFDNFLMFCLKYRLDKSNNFFYNLTYDINALIKHLPYQRLLELAELNETVHNDVIIKILPEKCLEIKYLKRTFKFFDIAQFFNKISLDSAGERVLGINKIKLPFDISKLSAEKYYNDYEYRAIINKYLKRDTEITYKLCEYLIKITKKFMIPKYFYSQASFSQQYFLENMTRDYKIQSKHILHFGLMAYNGGRFEVFKRGTYDNVSSYDIRSAYPYQNVNIPSLDTGRWIRSKQYDETALISLFKVNVEGKSHISPMKAEDNNRIFYPVGKKQLYINKKEYETMKLYGYKVEILDGFNYYDEHPEHPYRFLQKFFNEKERVGKEHADYMFYKIIINGFYGKTIQLQEDDELFEDMDIQSKLKFKNEKDVFKKKNFKAGLLFNPIVAQEITGNTRSMLLDAVVDIQEDVIAFATDSITCLKKPKIKIGSKLGDWDREDYNKRYTCLGSGVSFYENEKMKFRGFGKGYNPKEVIKGNTDKIILPVKRSIKLKKTFKSVDKDISKFNLIINDKKELNLNFDKKRIWNDKFNNSSEVYTKQIESKPIEVQE